MLRRAARSASTLLVGLAALGSGCGDPSRASPSASAAPTALAPVPEPEHIGATLSIPDGGAAWEHLRSALGGDRSLLPSRFGSFIATAVGLPIGCAELVSDHEPVVGVMRDPTLLAPFEGAIAVHLRSADGVLSAATQGALATFRSERKAGVNGDLLVRLGAGPSVSLGVFGNHLIIGTSVDAVSSLGPYLSRTLAPAAAHAPKEGRPAAPEATLDVRADTLALALPVLRMKASLPEGPAGSVLNPTLAELFRRVDGATHLAVTLAIGDKSTRVDAIATIPAGARAPTAPVAELLDLPGSIDLGLLDPHAATATGAVSPFGAIAEWLDPAERADAERAGAKLAEARAPGSLIGFEDGPVGPAIYARAKWVDAARGRDALAELVKIADRDATKVALRAHGVELSGKRTVVANIGSVVRFRIGPAPKDPKAPAADPARQVDVLFRDTDTTLDVASGAEAITALTNLVDRARLGADEETSALVGLLPKDANAAAFLDVARLVHGARASQSRGVVIELDAPDRVTLSAVLDAEALRTIVGASLK